jgi:putative oxidoreductase
MKWLAGYSDYAYALLRIITGILFAFHGAQKLMGLFAQARPVLGSQLWIAGVIELFGGLAVALGLGTRWVALICCGEMAVAYFQVHWKLQVNSQFFPIVNKGELALLYCFLFLFIATRGGVKWSLGK